MLNITDGITYAATYAVKVGAGGAGAIAQAMLSLQSNRHNGNRFTSWAEFFAAGGGLVVVVKTAQQRLEFLVEVAEAVR